MKEFGSFLVQMDRKYNTWCKYTKRLDTYGCGCAHDCKYCYARALLNFRGNWHPENPRIAFITEIEKSISMLGKNEVVRLGGMTDCFQPYEQMERVTLGTIKLLNKYKINHLIVTKSELVVDPCYLEIYDPELVHFQITISCTDDSKAFEFEKCSPVSHRIKAIEKLHKMGFDVSVRLSPFLYQYTDEKIINSIKCNKILIEFLKVNNWIRKNFNYDFSYHTLKYGGHDNLELSRKIELLKSITSYDQCTVGEFVPEHHEYFRLNYNHNPLDCCNLNIRRIWLDEEQLELELKTDGTK